MTERNAPMRVLVIDDNPDDRQLEIREVYALFPDALVIELTDFNEFDAALAEGEPDLVLTDLDLRWASGRDVLQTVKARYPACPVVMFTGTGSEEIAVELMKAGLDDYVVKSPRQMPRLRASLKIAVEMAASRAALSDRELRLARALAQQQTITRELHHRVKNNLQTITSLLHLRGRGADDATRAYLDEVAGRMEALGAVQARIYDTTQYDRVDFSAALADIARSLIAVHREGQVTLVERFTVPLELDVQRAMPLSLLCYEIVLNAVKHAWAADGTGVLTVGIVADAGSVRIDIADDGLGFVESTSPKGLGTRLMRSLASEAGIVLDIKSLRDQGTSVSLRIQ